MGEKEPVRVLHVVQRMEAAGLQSFIMNIYRELDRTKVQFDFLVHYTERQFYDDEIESMGGRIYRLSIREDKNIIKYFWELHAFFEKHREYKIVHGHMDSLGVFYLAAAKKANIPCRIAHAHTVLIGGGIKRTIRNLLNRQFKRNATLLLACSNMAGEYMFGNSAFHVIHNPIKVNSFKFNPSVRRDVQEELHINNNVVIGHVGRFSFPKNHKFLLDVFEELLKKESTAKLLLIGTGELEGEIRMMIEKRGLNNSVLLGGVRSDINRIYQAMDAFVFPSLYEGLGIVAIEAQAAGLPTICSERIPKLAQVTDLFSALSLDESPEVWAKHILSVLRNTRNDRSQYYQELINAGYDVSQVKTELLKFYGIEF